MTVSIIISTYNGAAKLPRILEHLRQQTIRDFELLVIVDGSKDNSVEVAESFRNYFLNYKVIFQENRGRAGVRNRGVDEATGELIIFYDDDMAPMSDSVERHISFHQDHVGIVSGRSVDLATAGDSDIQAYKAAMSEEWFAKYSNGLIKLTKGNFFLGAASCSMLKVTFRQLRGFDERLRDAEDFDLGVRAMEQGIPLFFDNQNRAVHHDMITAYSYVRRLRQYSAAHDRLAEFHPERSVRSVRKSSGWRRQVYTLLAYPGLLRAIDHGYFIFLPTKVRYQWYSMIIHALAVEHPEVEL